MDSLTNVIPKLNKHYENDNKNIVYNLLMIFVLSEKNIKEIDSLIQIDDRLKKRRVQYEYDKYLQHWISKINVDNYIKTNIIECGNSGFSKTEMIVNDIVFFHFNHSFNCNAIYNRKYLKMNIDANSPKFAYFLYDLNKAKDTVVKLELIIPNNLNDARDYKLDLTKTLNSFREKVIEGKYDLKSLISTIPLLNTK